MATTYHINEFNDKIPCHDLWCDFPDCGSTPLPWFPLLIAGEKERSERLKNARNAEKTKLDYRLTGCYLGCEEGVEADGIIRCRHGFRKPQQSEPSVPRPQSPNLTSCGNTRTLRSYFRQCVKLLSADQGLPSIKYNDITGELRCGQLRKCMERMYEERCTLTSVQRLSIKTVQKLEPQPCEFCEERFASLVDDWEGKRKESVDVSDTHLQQFKKAFSMNVEQGWNLKGRAPFVPNGHGSLENRRMKNGNWNEEKFSTDFRTELVFSSGKPRIVTMYSSFNQRVLKPLHSALFHHISRRGWLLVGPPNEKVVSCLNGEGKYESFDYTSATDNFKTAYVQEMVEILIQKGEKLSKDEERCLRVVSNLTIDGELCGKGQPMGSLMSFPLLCLLNKTVVDMALADTLLSRGDKKKGVPWKQHIAERWDLFVGHRCLINGDDLLLKDPLGDGKFRERLTFHGGHVGLVVNEEKSVSSKTDAEINSTLFVNGKHIKKTNTGLLRNKKSDVGDIVALCLDSTATKSGFNYCIAACADALAVQKKKHYNYYYHIATLRRIKKVRAALTKRPTPQKAPWIPLPMVDKPEDFELTEEDTFACINSAVDEVRPKVLSHSPRKVRPTIEKDDSGVYDSVDERYARHYDGVLLRDLPGKLKRRRHKIYPFTLLRKEKPAEDRETVMKCLSDFFHGKKWNALTDGDVMQEQTFFDAELLKNKFITPSANAYAQLVSACERNEVETSSRNPTGITENNEKEAGRKSTITRIIEMIQARARPTTSPLRDAHRLDAGG